MASRAWAFAFPSSWHKSRRTISWLAVFKRSVEDALRRSSSAFHILRQLEESGLKDCARCTGELEAKLASNPHYLVLGKIAEAEKLITELRTYKL